jgi:hypothetical protein
MMHFLILAFCAAAAGNLLRTISLDDVGWLPAPEKFAVLEHPPWVAQCNTDVDCVTRYGSPPPCHGVWCVNEVCIIDHALPLPYPCFVDGKLGRCEAGTCLRYNIEFGTGDDFLVMLKNENVTLGDSKFP